LYRADSFAISVSLGEDAPLVEVEVEVEPAVDADE
jgi:hypothetical protein